MKVFIVCDVGVPGLAAILLKSLSSSVIKAAHLRIEGFHMPSSSPLSKLHAVLQYFYYRENIMNTHLELCFIQETLKLCYRDFHSTRMQLLIMKQDDYSFIQHSILLFLSYRTKLLNKNF